MQIAADRRPRPGGILAYAAGKDQRVQTSHLHDIAADSRANAFGKQRQRQSRRSLPASAACSTSR